MRKFILGLVFLCLALPAFPEELSLGDYIKKLPAVKQGIMWNMRDHDVKYLSSIEVANWKGVSLEAGYTPANELVGILSYKILSLKKLGVDIPILDLIEFQPGFCVGYKRIDLNRKDEEDSKGFFGLSMTLINLKF